MLTNPLAAYHDSSRYRWVILAMCVLTPMFVVTMPNLSLPPLFTTISADVGLSLVEIGTIWGIGSFAGVFFSLIGGTLGDRFGTRATLFTACLLTGAAGLLRAFAVDFGTLLITSLLYGIFQAGFRIFAAGITAETDKILVTRICYQIYVLAVAFDKRCVEFGITPAIFEIEFGAVAHGGVHAVLLEDMPFIWPHQIYGGKAQTAHYQAEFLETEKVEGPAGH